MTPQDNTNLIEATNRDVRVKETQSWTVEEARKKAAEMGLELDDQRIDVLKLLRDIYIEHGWEMPTHELTQMLDERYADKGGIKQLHMLFPEGPITQGTELAGLPIPPYAEDKGFGSAQ